MEENMKNDPLKSQGIKVVTKHRQHLPKMHIIRQVYSVTVFGRRQKQGHFTNSKWLKMNFF